MRLGQIVHAEGGFPTQRSRVGGGSNAIGLFSPASSTTTSSWLVEAANACGLGSGRTGVRHGARSSLLADEDGQVLDAESISAGLDYPGVEAEHAFLRDSGRARYLQATDEEALAAFRRLAGERRHPPRARAGSRPRPGRRPRCGADRPLPLRSRRQGSCECLTSRRRRSSSPLRESASGIFCSGADGGGRPCDRARVPGPGRRQPRKHADPRRDDAAGARAEAGEADGAGRLLALVVADAETGEIPRLGCNLHRIDRHLGQAEIGCGFIPGRARPRVPRALPVSRRARVLLGFERIEARVFADNPES